MSGVAYSDLQTWGNLVELYAGDLVFQENIMNSYHNTFKKASKDEVEFDGAHWNQGVTFQLNESYGAKNDGERLPDPDYQKGVFAQYVSKLMYAQIEATTYAATRGYKNGRPTGKYLDDLIKGTLMTFSSNCDFDAYGNGRGFRATIATAVAAATSFTVTFSTRLRAGMTLDWYDSTYTTYKGSIKISLQGVDHIARTAYIDTTFGTAAVPSTAAAGDVLVVYGALAPGEPTDGRHLAGYTRLTDNTVSLGGLSPSNYALWQAVSVNAGLANPNQELLQQVHDQLYIVSGLYPDMFVFNPAWKRGYLSGFLGQRRFTSNTFDTGAAELTWTAVKMGQDETKKKPTKMQMIEDKNQDPSKTFIYANDCIRIATDYSNEPHLADEDGAEFRFRIGFDSMQAFIRLWENTVVKQRNGLGIITNWATPSGTV